MADRFVPGLELSRRLFLDHVAPLLRAEFPQLRYAAALIGPGSEVLGFDTARSTDHDWGPRLQLFLHSGDSPRHGPAITALLAQRLPKAILGHPTNFVTVDGGTTRHMQLTDGPVSHGVQATDLGGWFVANLGFDPRPAVETLDWLATPTQILAGVTAGAVFHDDIGELTHVRDRLAWYPDDVWRYVLAAQWQRIAEEEPFVGRCGEVGDELGSAVIAARLARDLMRLQLLQHRHYPPYGKWLGCAFARTPHGARLGRHLAQAISAPAWSERERALAAVYEHLARTQNRLELAPFLDPSTRTFHDRPFRVLHAERFAEALRAAITDPVVRRAPVVGAVDQWIDSTTAMGRHRCRRRAQQAMLAGDAAPCAT